MVWFFGLMMRCVLLQTKVCSSNNNSNNCCCSHVCVHRCIFRSDIGFEMRERDGNSTKTDRPITQLATRGYSQARSKRVCVLIIAFSLALTHDKSNATNYCHLHQIVPVPLCAVILLREPHHPPPQTASFAGGGKTGPLQRLSPISIWEGRKN